MEYPEVNVYGGTAGGSYVLNAINVEKPDFLVEWTPLMNTAATETLMSGPDIVSCLTTDLSGSSQEVPFYNWVKEWAAPNGFGGEDNDWQSRYGPYKGSSSEWTYNTTTPNYPSVGDLQNKMAQSQFGNTVNENGLPLITKSSDKHMNFSRPMFYYFGLRPGKTSFDIFVTKYIDEDSSETVI